MQGLCSQWKLLGLSLKAPYDQLEVIEKDGYGSKDQMLRMLAEWLRGSRERPSWKALCNALKSMREFILADNISELHVSCDCSTCAEGELVVKKNTAVKTLLSKHHADCYSGDILRHFCMAGHRHCNKIGIP